VFFLAGLWAVAFVPLGFLWFLWGYPYLPPDADPLRSCLERIALALVYGALCGGLFALVLSTISRWRSVLSLRSGHAARWGAITGLFFPAITTLPWAIASGSPARLGVALVTLGLSTGLGALCGAGTVRLAARAPAVLEPGWKHNPLPGSPDLQ
jgi:hypothetical protein